MPSELYEPFFKTVGATGHEHLRVLGMMQTDEVMTEISGMTIENSLTLIQKGSARYLAYICRSVAGTENLRRRSMQKPV